MNPNIDFIQNEIETIEAKYPEYFVGKSLKQFVTGFTYWGLDEPDKRLRGFTIEFGDGIKDEKIKAELMALIDTKLDSI